LGHIFFNQGFPQFFGALSLGLILILGVSLGRLIGISPQNSLGLILFKPLGFSIQIFGEGILALILKLSTFLWENNLLKG